MKYSGVEWIGNIPEKWELTKIGQLFNLRNDKVSDREYEPLSVSKIGVVQQLENVAKSDASDDRKLVLKGDFAINSRSDRKMSCGVSPLNGSVSLINTVLYPKNSNVIYNDYMNYLLKNYGFAEEFYRWGHGIVADLWTTRWQEMKSILLPLPSLDMQKRIFSFLSAKTIEIDSLIEIENQQIEKLKEYKQAVITEAVTEGQEKNVAMKDSGIEWIEKIPEETFVVPLKFLLAEPMMYGANESGLREKIINGYRYIRITDIDADGNLKDGDENQYLTQEKGEYYNLSEGDVLFARSGGTVGKTFIYHESYGKSAFAGYLIKGKCDLNKLLPEYLYLYTQSSIYELWKQQIFIQATIQNIGANKYSMLPIIVGSLEWQKKIVSYVQTKINEIDELILCKQQKIEQLDEYKKSLIYEYVTGKKEVI